MPWTTRVKVAAGFTAATGVAFFALLGVSLYAAFWYNTDIAPSGYSETFPEADVGNYGFGPNKKLMVIDISEIGGVAQIDLKDKEHATLKLYRDDHDGNGVELKASGDNDNYLDIGIEIKGRRDRVKLNYKVEIWKLDDGEWEDDKASLLKDGEKYEDWVLRGGFFEPTLTRDKLAADSPRETDAKYEAELHELVFCVHGQCTYEGVYLLMEGISRRMLEKTLEWPEIDDNTHPLHDQVDGGKSNCDDYEEKEEDLVEPQHSTIMFEYTVQEHKTHVCGPDNIYSIYPKCDKLTTEGCAGFFAYHMPFYEAIDSGNVDIVNIDSWSDRFVLEMFLVSDDFTFASQFFYKPPESAVVDGWEGGTAEEAEIAEAESKELHFLPPYDFDGFWWRSYTDGLEKTRKLEFVNRDYYGAPVPAVWQALGKHRPFIDTVKTLGSRVGELNNKMQGIIQTRLHELDNGYWDRNNARWKPYGRGQYVAGVERGDYLLYPGTAVVKDTMREELEFASAWYAKRANSIINQLPELEVVEVTQMPTTAAILLWATPLFVVTGLFLISGITWAVLASKDNACCTCGEGAAGYAPMKGLPAAGGVF